MIVRPDGDHLVLISQPDHARLSGLMAGHWGNALFAGPEPRAAVLLAVNEHDNGWEEWDAQPRVNPATGQPYAFTQMPVAPYLEIWRRGIGRIAERDLYAGMLVGRHGMRLVGRRLARAADPPAVLAEIARFIAETEARERAAQAECAGRAGWGAGDEARLETHYALLRTCDTLSLLLCCGPLTPATVEEAPGAGSEERLTLHLTPRDAATLACQPFPFDVPEIHLTVTGRRIPQRVYRSDEELAAALATADPAVWEVVIGRAGATAPSFPSRRAAPSR